MNFKPGIFPSIHFDMEDYANCRQITREDCKYSQIEAWRTGNKVDLAHAKQGLLKKVISKIIVDTGTSALVHLILKQ